MIKNYGKQEFAVDFDEEFIQMYKCYLEGTQCSICDCNTDCAEELPFVYNELLRQEECIDKSI